MFKRPLIILIFFLLTACAPDEGRLKSKTPVGTPIEAPIGAPVESTGVPTEPQPERPLEPPSAVNWPVPFFPQAPDADWNLPWQEACEEASVLLTWHYTTRSTVTKEQFKSEIQQMIRWENETFGDYRHTTVEQTARVVREHLQFQKISILESPTADQLKSVLSRGSIIVAPFAGRRLGNPFYSGEGPYYHMLVIKGYDEKHFIVNDVGTRRGENFIYPYHTLLSALHDWDGEDIEKGEKKVIIFEL